jgi:predicted nucleic acid-binding protein
LNGWRKVAGGQQHLDRWVQPADPNFEVVQLAVLRLETSGEIPCFTPQNLGEFWNSLTRPPGQNGYGLTPREADQRAHTIESRFRLLPDNIEVYREWRKLLVDYNVSGVQVHDARLVASMFVHGVKRILTFNARDFARYSGIEAVHPAQLS